MKPIQPIHQTKFQNYRQFFDQIYKVLTGNITSNNMTTTEDGQLPIYANNAAAKAANLIPGQFYRRGTDPDLVCVVH